MEFCHTDIFLHSPAAQRLVEFIQKRREQWATPTDLSNVDKFESFEQDLHTLVMALECELVSEELSRYDMAATRDRSGRESVSSWRPIARDVSDSSRSSYGGTPFVLSGRRKRSKHLPAGIA